MKLRTLPWMLVAVLFAGCFFGGTGRRGTNQIAAPAGPAERSQSVNPVRSAAVTDYRLAPRDQVVFEMFNEPDVKTTQRLSSKGEMTLPLVGTITLAGMTLREAEREIRKRYADGGYYTDPHVILSVAEYGFRYVTVLGQVNRPDRIELPIETASIGVVEAITQAGGFTNLARTDAVQITRQTAAATERHLTVDVRDFLGQRGEGAEEFQLQPGDVVFVPERLF